MKTFDQLVPNDRIYRGMDEDDTIQITKIEDNPQTGGRVFYVWVNDEFLHIQREDRFEIPYNFLNGVIYRRTNKGLYYSCREAAVRLKIQYLQKSIDDIQAAINAKYMEMAKIQQELDGYTNLLNNITIQF